MNPTSNYVVIKTEKKTKVTPSGIVIPDSIDGAVPSKGTVMAIGPGLAASTGVIVPMTVAVGDTVHFTPGAGHNVVINGQDVLLMRESDILIIVDKE